METERMETEGLLGAQASEQQPKPYIFYNDPGHGWLQVPVSELVQLGIADKISGYSYLHKDKAYLEEDCDAAVFLRAKFGQDFSFGSLEKRGLLVEKYQEYTPIRNYQPYSV